MKLKKLFVVSLLLAAGIFLRGDKAFAATRTWDGSAGDKKFSTGANWSDDTAPVSGDSVIFPASAALTTYGESIDNDIANLSLVDVTINGDAGTTCDGTYEYYRFTGNTLTLTGGIDAAAMQGTCWNPITFSLNLTLTAATFTVATPSGQLTQGAPIILGDSLQATTLALGSTNLAFSGDRGGSIGASINGTGTISVVGDAGLYLDGDNTSFTGAISLAGGNLSVYGGKALGGGTSPVVIGDGVSLVIDATTNALTIARPITLTGAGNAGFAKLLFGVTQSCSGIGDTTLAGAFTLQSNATYQSYCAAKLIISNPVLNGHSLTAASGNAGTLVINGTETKPEYAETVITDNLPNASLYIQAYGRYIVNGVRGMTTVSMTGILMGTGRVGELYVNPGGILAPGASPGCLSSGNLELYGEYWFEANGATVCTQYDQMKVTGTVRLTQDINQDAKSAILKVNFLDKYNPAAGTKFVIIENDGNDAVAGTFQGLVEGATFEGPNKSVLRVSYKGGDGNDVEITVITAGTPDTGFGMILNNPVLTLGITGAAASAILIMSRCMQFATKRARR